MIRRPGVYVEEVSSARRPIEAVSTSVAAFVGLSVSGPLDEPVRVMSFLDFERIFGALSLDCAMGFSVRMFFENGGTEAVIVRVSGRDGARVSDDDVAPSDSASGLGIYALDKVDIFNVLCLPPLSSDEDVSAVAFGRAADYCLRRNAILIVDMPVSVNDAGLAKDYLRDVLLPSIPDSARKNVVVYFPRVMTRNQNGNSFGSFAASGAVAGLFARNDLARGVWKAPAGSDAKILGVSGLSYPVTSSQYSGLNARGINCLRSLPSSGIVVYGSKTLDCVLPGSEWKYVPVRRLALHIESSISGGLRWVAYEANSEALWAEMRVLVDSFMNGLFRRGAFAGAKPSDAYFVKCDRETTTQVDIDGGFVNIVVGFAPLKPAEFVVLRIQLPVLKNESSVSGVSGSTARTLISRVRTNRR